MMNPELRSTGKLIRRLMPKMTPTRFKMLNKLLSVKRGHNNTKLNYNQRFILRPDGSKLRVCIYQSKHPRRDAPGLLWLHGGGYAIGSPELETSLFADIVDRTGAVLIAPDYRLTIEKPYPAALDDAYLALTWLRDHVDEYDINENQLIVAGPSAGGGLTAALSLYANAKNEINIAFQMPLYPMLDNHPTPSMVNNNAPVWNEQYNQVAWRMNLRSIADQSHIPQFAAPANADTFENFPPTISFIGEIDPFLDETTRFINRLNQAGVPTSFKTFPGAFHMFEVFAPKTAVAKQAHSFMLDSFEYGIDHYFASQNND